MTATTKSVPAQLADEIEALGWIVQRAKYGTRREIMAEHGDERVKLVFERKAMRGAVPYRDVLHRAEYSTGGTLHRTFRSTSEALQFIRKMPFALDWPDDKILAAVAGKTVEWTSRISGKIQSGVVPRGGMHLRIAGNEATAPEDRVLHFTDPLGFHAVRLGAIVAVK